MSKTMFCLVISLALFFPKKMIATEYNESIIGIYVEFDNPYQNPASKPRMPIKIPTVSLDGHLIYFNALGDSCTLEVTDENNDVVYSRLISAEETCFLLPSTLKGQYLIKFIFENLTYWGYIEL